MAKRIVVGLCGLVCVLFIVSAASARPPTAKRLSRFNQVARPGMHQVRAKTMRNRTVRHRSARMPARLQKPRQQGDVVGNASYRHRTTKRYSKTHNRRARAAVKRILDARIKPAIRCPEGAECGASLYGKARNSSKNNNRSFLRSRSERQQQYFQKRLEIRMEKREPAPSKGLHGPCYDAADCL